MHWLKENVTFGAYENDRRTESKISNILLVSWDLENVIVYIFRQIGTPWSDMKARKLYYKKKLRWNFF